MSPLADRILAHLDDAGFLSRRDGDVAVELATELDAPVQEVVDTIWKLTHQNKLYARGEGAKIYSVRILRNANGRTPEPSRIQPSTTATATGEPRNLGAQRARQKVLSAIRTAGSVTAPNGRLLSTLGNQLGLDNADVKGALLLLESEGLISIEYGGPADRPRMSTARLTDRHGDEPLEILDGQTVKERVEQIREEQRNGDGPVTAVMVSHAREPGAPDDELEVLAVLVDAFGHLQTLEAAARERCVAYVVARFGDLT